MAAKNPVIQKKRPGISYANSLRSLIKFLRNPAHKNASSEAIALTNIFSILSPPGVEDDTYDQNDVRTCVGPHQNGSNDVRTCVGPHQITVTDVRTCVGPHPVIEKRVNKDVRTFVGPHQPQKQMMCAPVWGLIIM